MNLLCTLNSTQPNSIVKSLFLNVIEVEVEDWNRWRAVKTPHGTKIFQCFFLCFTSNWNQTGSSNHPNQPTNPLVPYCSASWHFQLKLKCSVVSQGRNNTEAIRYGFQLLEGATQGKPTDRPIDIDGMESLYRVSSVMIMIAIVWTGGRDFLIPSSFTVSKILIDNFWIDMIRIFVGI